MDNVTNFDKLIIKLSSNEKKELLSKMERGFELSQEPLVEKQEIIETEYKNFQQEYESLTIFYKIVLFIQSFVKHKDIPTLLKESRIYALRRKHFNDCNRADFKNGLLKD